MSEEYRKFQLEYLGFSVVAAIYDSVAETLGGFLATSNI